MTIDDDNSVYVGGLPYDASEDHIREVFGLYGSVVAVKIIKDRAVGGKCYGFSYIFSKLIASDLWCAFWLFICFDAASLLLHDFRIYHIDAPRHEAIEVINLDQQTEMVAELDGHIMRYVLFYDQVMTLSIHPYGCRVMQRVLEHCSDAKTQCIVMDEISQSVCMLAQDQYGNYVVQHVLEHGKPLEQRQILVNEMLGSTDENEPLQVMMKDQFANYVVQKVLETCDDQQLELILNRIKVHLNALKKYTYRKHIVARVEKLVAAEERRIGVLF
ncbi:hypothetical protein F0562_030035 [Nyssa sinensis]|uniref:PUM-HD domain-containing protein n=1 Tax=Nyssa sinensis TaxID=561372 RepID=A0A5J5AZ81_9ASTE|nr:hypothetical protein F0562_030035 [Nyssa sinensis]